MTGTKDQVLPNRRLFSDNVAEEATCIRKSCSLDYEQGSGKKQQKFTSSRYSPPRAKLGKQGWTLRSGKSSPVTERRPSPTSVDCHPAYLESMTIPTITMCDNGAEVSLGVTGMYLQTPQKQSSVKLLKQTTKDCSLPHGSLLDIDSPSPAVKQTPTNRNMGLCCYSSSSTRCWQGEDEYQVSAQQQVQSMISTVLENSQTYASCEGWQDWSYAHHNTPEKTTHVSKDVLVMRENLRRRVCDRHQRKARVDRLRADIDPFQASPAGKRPHELFPSQSFSMKARAPVVAKVSKPPSQKIGLASILQSCTGQDQTNVTSPVFIRSCRDDMDMGYDSDPEDFLRTRTVRERGVRAGKENAVNSGNRVYPRPMPVVPTGNIADVGNDIEFRTSVQEFFNETATMKFHPSAKGSSSNNAASTRPHAVCVWVERGQRLHGIVQPKLMWRSLHQNGMKGSSVCIPSISSLDLLDICRIVKVDKINRAEYPLAKSKHCLMVRGIDNTEYFFEAASIAERDRIAYSLKLVVARFGTKVILADDCLFDEFFVNSDGGVPGDLPDWANGNSAIDSDSD